MIEDKELREMFRAESMEHISNIESGLLALERTPDSTALLDEVFREAHSLKGASRMLGLRDIQNLAHEIENLLGEARQEKFHITLQEVTPQLAKLDQLRRLVAQAVGDTATSPVASSKPTRPTVAYPVEQPPRAIEPSVGAPTPLPDFRIDTLRIESSRLDTLLQLSAELLVSNRRIARWDDQLAQLLGQCEARLKNVTTADPWLTGFTDELARMSSHIASDIARQQSISNDLESGIRTLRLLPMSTLLELFPRMVHDLSIEFDKKITCRVEGATTVADKRIIEEIKAPLTHLLRNCIDHGIELPADRLQAGKPEHGQIKIVVTQSPAAVNIEVSDDGRGLDMQAIRQQCLTLQLRTADELEHMTEAQVQALVLEPGFSTSRMITDLSGRGVGLDVVRAGIERLRGALTLESTPGHGTVIRLRLPVSLTSTHAILLSEWGQTYAVAFDDIAFLKRLHPGELHNVEGRHCFYHGDQAIALERLGLLLELAPPALNEGEPLECVVLKVGGETFAISLDQVLDSEDLVIKPTSTLLTRVRNVAGMAILNSGVVCPVLSAGDLLRTMNRSVRASTQASETATAQPQKTILLVEDSITTRMQERRILESAGYTVETAVDGLDAWNKLSLRTFDAVVSDINMPRMSGLELAEKIRANRNFSELPIVLITSLATEDDRRRGLEAGADAYISKSDFDQTLLLDSLARLV